MRENFVQSMEKQVEAQLHEESKLWSFIALCQANQVCKEENQRRNLTTSNFAQHAKSRGASIVTGQRVGMSERNFAHHAKPRCYHEGISNTMRNFVWYAKSSCVISKYLCTDSVRFLSSNILCNFLVSPCNQPRYFILYLFIYLLGSRYIRRDMCDIIMDVFY